MEEFKNKYVNRTQKNYSLSFKLSVVSDIERGDISITESIHKYDIQGNTTISHWLKNMVSIKERGFIGVYIKHQVVG